MPPLLRSAYLTCWYCQTKSNQRKTPTLRQWKCTSCESVNHLDANGHITDPPAYSNPNTPKASRNQYAHLPAPHRTSQQSTVFCRTCTQNQHFYTEALASYLPDSNDPEYHRYLDKLDEYKTNLVKRYPQLCPECEPKVNRRMRETTKAAQDDHLRRKLVQSKVKRLVDWKRWGWKRVAIFAGGLLWSMSLCAQIEYHAMGMLPSAEVQDDTTYTSWLSTQKCVWIAARTNRSQLNCLVATHERAWSGLWLGLLSCWWNNKLAEALYSQARIRGVNNHMALQTIVLLVRAAALWSLDLSSLRDSGIPLNAAHGFMLIFLFLTALTSLRSVRLIKAPKVSFSGLKPVLADPSTTPRQISYESTHTTTAFPISSLGRQHSPEHNYSASNYDFDDSDDTLSVASSSMDWIPTESTEIKQINPRRPAQPAFQSPYRHVGPSPFRGTLPPAPQAPAQKARNPRSMQPFISASKEKKEMFAKRMAGDDQSGDFGGSRRGDYALQQPTLVDREAESRETGLESLFNAAFSVSNEPAEVASSLEVQEREGFLPGIESASSSFQNSMPTKPKGVRQIYDDSNDGAGNAVPEAWALGWLFLALAALALAMLVRQGWGHWSEVGSFVWKVLNGGGEGQKGGGEELGGIHHVLDEFGREIP
ncbi:GDP-Man:Man(3)GlcNAc(2)-PP-Dol alpha-1,2-mannosyltransferase [Venturia inaequalis]|nr:GDP-Man:Man(3)GlcNAc(2)-PP-Dol alpha-1,2-mannosyltransferase [Venturia inaequalis]